MRSLVKGDHCSYIDIDFLLQRKFQLCGQQICDMYQLLGLYQKLNAKSICSCVNKSVQAINKGNNETQDSYSEKSLIKEVEEVLSRAHLTLFPHQTEKTLIVILESGKSVSLSKEKSIEQTKSKTYNSHLPSRHKQNFPAFCKVPYKTDMCMWKRGRIVSSNHQTVKTPMKIKEHKNTMEENNCVIKECTGEQKHIKHSCLQNMNLISDLDPECACSQSQELQRAGLVRQLDKGLYRLRFLVWRIGQITKWDGEDILLTFYKKYVTKSEVIPSMYLPIQSCNLAGVLFDRFSSLILLIDINMASQEEIYWIRCILSRFIHLLKMLKLILARTNHRSSGSHVSSQDISYNSSIQNDRVNAWFASKQPVRSVVSPSPYETYLTIGNCSNQSGMTSRLSALTSCRRMCVFSGSKKEIRLFTNLWSELESIQIEFEMLNIFKSKLPELLTDLFSHTENRASAFRDLHTLVCGNSPSVLKSNL